MVLSVITIRVVKLERANLINKHIDFETKNKTHRLSVRLVCLIKSDFNNYVITNKLIYH